MSNISPIKPSSDGYGSGKVGGPNRPQRQPRDDSFRKLSKDRRQDKKQDPSEIETDEDTAETSTPSLFDLSRHKPKSAPATKWGTLEKNQEDAAALQGGKTGQAGSEPVYDYASEEGEGSSPSAPMTGKNETKDQRLFENLLTKTSDKAPMEGPGMKGKSKAGLTSTYLAETEIEEQQLEGSIDADKEGDSKQQELEKKKPAQLAANTVGRQQADQAQALKTARVSKEESQADALAAASKKDKVKKGNAPTEEAEDYTRLSAVNAAIQGARLDSDKTGLQDKAEITRSETIRDIAAQIVEKIQVMRDSDMTKTIVTLRHPPILEGATVTLAVSDNAKNELNISFANLSPDAKLFLDRKLNEDSLTQTLERKGIIVHMITTTTQAEVLTAQAGQPTKEDQQQQQREQQQQQQQEREQQEEEER